MKNLSIAHLYFSGIAALLLAGGCAVGPDYQRATVETPANFTGVGTEWKEATPQDTTAKGPWWEMYQDPQLNALEKAADENNQNLKAAMARVDQVRALTRIAKADFCPSLSLDPSGSVFRESANQPLPPPAPQAAFSASDIRVPLDLSYEADIWGRVRRSNEAAVADFQVGVADYETIRLTMHAEVAQTYFSLSAVDAELAVLQSTVATRQRSLDLIQDRFQGGASSDLEVAQAENALATTQADLAEVEKQRETFEHALSVLVGRPPETFHLVATTLTQSPPEIPIGTPASLLERRPDVAEAERAMAAANARIGVAKAAYFPVVKLIGTAGFESTDFGTLFDWPSRLWAVGPSISIPLFEGGRNDANYDRAEAAYVETVAQYRQHVLVALQEVEDSLSGLRTLAQRAAAQERAVASAQRAYDIANSRYKEGSISFLDVVDVQRTLLQNQREAVQTLGQRFVTSVLLVQALGGGWQDSPIQQFYPATKN